MKKQSQTYCVTGAAGFIGSYICRALLTSHRNSTIVGIDNINAYYDPKIKLRRIRELSQNKRFHFYKTSILNRQKIRSIFASYPPTILVHAAAQVGVRNGERHPNLYFSTNVLGTMTVLEEASSYISHVLIFSSSSIYGSTTHVPFRESQLITSAAALSVYGASKIAMETAARTFYKKTNIPITIVRPFSIYGPDGRPDMLPMKLLIAARNKKIVKLYAPDKTWRDWTYVDDCIDSIRALLQKPSGLRIVNIGSGKPIRLDRTVAIAQTVIRRYGCSFQTTKKPANPTELAKTWADTRVLHGIHKTEKQTDFETGYHKTAAYFFAHKDRYR